MYCKIIVKSTIPSHFSYTAKQYDVYMIKYMIQTLIEISSVLAFWTFLMYLI